MIILESLYRNCSTQLTTINGKYIGNGQVKSVFVNDIEWAVDSVTRKFRAFIDISGQEKTMIDVKESLSTGIHSIKSVIHYHPLGRKRKFKIFIITSQNPAIEDLSHLKQKALLATQLTQWMYFETIGRSFDIYTSVETVVLEDHEVEEIRGSSPSKAWEKIARHVLNSFPSLEEVRCLKFIAFTSFCLKDEKPLRQGSGSLAVLDNDVLSSVPATIEDFAKLSFSHEEMKFFSGAIGSIVHEVAHTLDLIHSKEGVMSGDLTSAYQIMFSTPSIVPWTESQRVILRYHKWLEENSVNIEGHFKLVKPCINNFILIESGDQVVVAEVRDITKGITRSSCSAFLNDSPIGLVGEESSTLASSEKQDEDGKILRVAVVKANEKKEGTRYDGGDDDDHPSESNISKNKIIYLQLEGDDVLIDQDGSQLELFLMDCLGNIFRERWLVIDDNT